MAAGTILGKLGNIFGGSPGAGLKIAAAAGITSSEITVAKVAPSKVTAVAGIFAADVGAAFSLIIISEVSAGATAVFETRLPFKVVARDAGIFGIAGRHGLILHAPGILLIGRTHAASGPSEKGIVNPVACGSTKHATEHIGQKSPPAAPEASNGALTITGTSRRSLARSIARRRSHLPIG